MTIAIHKVTYYLQVIGPQFGQIESSNKEGMPLGKPKLPSFERQLIPSKLSSILSDIVASKGL
jgi:hypothetical protein